jgi:uncharacterized protein
MTTMIAPVQTALPNQETATAKLRGVDLVGPAGRLEALLNEGVPDAPFAALVCHPHPLGGGNLHNKVVYRAMKAINDPERGLGWPVLRFNFRGTGLSQGAHDGSAEAGDVAAAIEWLEREYKRPLVVAGFSFGAAMTLAACCGPAEADANIRALVALGLPTLSNGRNYQYDSLRACAIDKFFLSGDHDQFAPAAQLVEVFASAKEPKRLQLLPGADHFFTGQLELMQQALSDWLKELLP